MIKAGFQNSVPAGSYDDIAVEEKPTIHGGLQTLASRLLNLNVGLELIITRLHGPRPASVAGQKSEREPATTEYLTNAHLLLTSAEGLLQELATSVG